MKLTIDYDEDTGLINLRTSGGTLSMTQTEVAGLYIILRNILGIKGRFLLFLKRRSFSKVY